MCFRRQQTIRNICDTRVGAVSLPPSCFKSDAVLRLLGLQPVRVARVGETMRATFEALETVQSDCSCARCRGAGKCVQRCLFRCCLDFRAVMSRELASIFGAYGHERESQRGGQRGSFHSVSGDVRLGCASARKSTNKSALARVFPALSRVLVVLLPFVTPASVTSATVWVSATARKGAVHSILIEHVFLLSPPQTCGRPTATLPGPSHRTVRDHII